MIEQLKEKTGLAVRENVKLSELTSFKIGGPAKYFVEVDNKAALQKVLAAAVELNLPYFIMGGGTNVLVCDDGFDGLTIKLSNGAVDIKGRAVTAFAGHDWRDLVKQIMQSDLEGFELCANIPGTVGGAVRGNAGAYGVSTGDYVRQVEVLVPAGNEVALKIINRDECGFGYRESMFKRDENKNLVIAEVEFELPAAIKPVAERLKQAADEYQSRCAKQPLKYPSVGCSFKNVIYTPDLPQYESWAVHGKIPAAKFIDAAGLKGMRIGGAMVSHEHANFIINVDNATADDVIQLISLIKMKVRDNYNVQLQEELQYIGFE